MSTPFGSTPNEKEHLKARSSPADMAHNVARGRSRLAVLPVSEIEVDRAYQRDLNSDWIEHNKPFDTDLAGVIVVSARGGRLFAIDGQHRYELARTSGEHVIDAKVLTGLTQTEEAALFVKYQETGRRLTSYALFRADIVAQNPAALAIRTVVHGVGFQLSRGSGTPREIQAIDALKWVYKVGGANLLHQTLMLIKEHWLGLPQATSGLIIRGTGRFIDYAETQTESFSMGRLGEVMDANAPVRILQIAQGIAIERSAAQSNKPYTVAEALRIEYDRRVPRNGTPIGPVPTRPTKAK